MSSTQNKGGHCSLFIDWVCPITTQCYCFLDRRVFNAWTHFTVDFSSCHSNLFMLEFAKYSSNHQKILHMHRQQCCRCMCNILWCFDFCISNYNKKYFRKFSSREIWWFFVKRAPELLCYDYAYVNFYIVSGLMWNQSKWGIKYCKCL